jgi:hypothetical protein
MNNNNQVQRDEFLIPPSGELELVGLRPYGDDEEVVFEVDDEGEIFAPVWFIWGRKAGVPNDFIPWALTACTHWSTDKNVPQGGGLDNAFTNYREIERLYRLLNPYAPKNYVRENLERWHREMKARKNCSGGQL